MCVTELKSIRPLPPLPPPLTTQCSVHLHPFPSIQGAQTTVTLNATAADLSVVDEAGRRWLRPASYTLRVGDVVAPARRAVELRGAEQLLEDLSGVFV